MKANSLRSWMASQRSMQFLRQQLSAFSIGSERPLPYPSKCMTLVASHSSVYTILGHSFYFLLYVLGDVTT